jgi:hypothetical protein
MSRLPLVSSAPQLFPLLTLSFSFLYPFLQLIPLGLIRTVLIRHEFSRELDQWSVGRTRAVSVYFIGQPDGVFRSDAIRRRFFRTCDSRSDRVDPEVFARRIFFRFDPYRSGRCCPRRPSKPTLRAPAAFR